MALIFLPPSWQIFCALWGKGAEPQLSGRRLAVLRYYGWYANRPRGVRKKLAAGSQGTDAPVAFAEREDLSLREAGPKTPKLLSTGPGSPATVLAGRIETPIATPIIVITVVRREVKVSRVAAGRFGMQGFYAAGKYGARNYLS
jgi:hypothetical protein